MDEFQWTGNPFVDTGLCAIIARAKELDKPINAIDDLTPEIFRDVVGDGSWLAEQNKRLKSYTMVFGKNGPLMQTSTNPLSQLESHTEKIAQKRQELLDAENEVRESSEQSNSETNPRNREKLQKKIASAETKAAKAREKLAEFESKLEAKQKKAAGGFDRGIEEYKIVISTLLEDVLTGEHSIQTICECSGFYKATRALSIASERIRRIGEERKDKNMSKREDFVVGRDWFPLAGSFNDAQALPAASRSPNLSAFCLLAVQFLPLGVQLLGKHFACFQTNDATPGRIPIFQYLAEDVYEQLRQRREAQAGKVENLGKGQGTTPTALTLHREFERLQNYQRGLQLPENITLNIFTFSNSGTSPECDVAEIPDAALHFLWEAARRFPQEIEGYLRGEGNDKEFQLLTRMQREQRYPSFYPRKVKDSKRIEVASRGLFELYCKQVLKISEETLMTAAWIAEQLKRRLQGVKGEKILDELKKSLGDSEKMRGFYAPLKGYFADFAENNLLTLDEYIRLFPSQLRPLRANMREGLRLIWYYLYQDTSDAQRARLNGDDESMFTHPKIKEFARHIFAYYTEEKRWRLDKFKARILEGFRRNEINSADVRLWFERLAEEHERYTSEDWDDLCRDDAGNNVTYEVLFQLRLELANLYRLAKQDGLPDARTAA